MLWLLVPFVHLVFETWSFYVDQADFELVSQLPNPRCWDSLCARPRLALFFLVLSLLRRAWPSPPQPPGPRGPHHHSLADSNALWIQTFSHSLPCPRVLLSSASFYQASTHALGCLVQSQALWASSCMAPLSLTSPSLGAVIPVTSLGRQLHWRDPHPHPHPCHHTGENHV